MSGIEIRKVTANIGAQISGVDISKPLDEETAVAVREALNVHKALVFDDVNLDDEGQQAFVRHLGDVTTAHPTVSSIDGAPTSCPSTASAAAPPTTGTPTSRSSSTRRRPAPCAASPSRRTAARP